MARKRRRSSKPKLVIGEKGRIIIGLLLVFLVGFFFLYYQDVFSKGGFGIGRKSKDKQPPRIRIVSPPKGSVVSGVVKVEVEAIDEATEGIEASGVDRVMIWPQGMAPVTLTSPPYVVDWDVSIMCNHYSKDISVEAYDVAGNRTGSWHEHNVEIRSEENPTDYYCPTDTTPPTIYQFCARNAPWSYECFDEFRDGQLILFTADATDNQNVKQITIYVDDKYCNSFTYGDTGGLFHGISCDWQVPKQPGRNMHKARGVVYDTAGNSSSVEITFEAK